MKEETTNSQPLNIALAAVGKRDAALLRMMVERMLAPAFAIVDAVSAAAIVIIDGDALEFDDTLAQLQAERPGIRCIVLALSPPQARNNEAIVYVRKPIHVPELIGELKKASVAKQVAALGASRTTPSLSLAWANRYPVVKPAEPRRLSENPDMLSVDICMAADPAEVLETIGILSAAGRIGTVAANDARAA